VFNHFELICAIQNSSKKTWRYLSNQSEPDLIEKTSHTLLKTKKYFRKKIRVICVNNSYNKFKVEIVGLVFLQGRVKHLDSKISPSFQVTYFYFFNYSVLQIIFTETPFIMTSQMGSPFHYGLYILINQNI